MPKQNSNKQKPKREWISRDAVFAALEMGDVLNHYDIQAGAGESYRVHCPFHEDDRPSCSINRKAKVFNCFACGEQGNVLDFIGGIEGLDPKADFRRVLEIAIAILGYNPSQTRIDRKSKTKCKSDQASSDANKDKKSNSSQAKGKREQSFETKKKPKSKNGKKSKRKVTAAKVNDQDESLEFEPNAVLQPPAFPLKLNADHPWLKARLSEICLTSKDAAKLGIGFETRANALMAGRVCFPIHNVNGELVAYAGRWASNELDDQGKFVDEKGREQERYKLPKGFRKQLELYNLHQVTQNFPETDCLVLVEGFWSTLRLSSLNVPTVGLMGCSLSKAQIELLKSTKVSNLILMLDGDEQGRKASERLTLLLAPDFFVKTIDLDKGIKPDTVSKAFLLNLRSQIGSPVPIKQSNDPGSDHEDHSDSQLDKPVLCNQGESKNPYIGAQLPYVLKGYYPY